MIFKALFGKKSEDEAPPQESFDSEDGWAEEPDPAPAAAKDPAEDYRDDDIDEEESEDDKILGEMNLRARAYEFYNRRKLKTIEERLSGFDKDIFRVLPALVHLNTKGLPGYIEERPRVPGGIWNYRVHKDTIDILKRMFPDADYRPLSLRKVGVKNQIYSLSAMGSPSPRPGALPESRKSQRRNPPRHLDHAARDRYNPFITTTKSATDL
jgi:hypothetical protein